MNKQFLHATITSSTLQRELGKVIKRVSINREHLTITSNGFPVAVIVSPEDYYALVEKAGEEKSALSQKTEG